MIGSLPRKVSVVLVAVAATIGLSACEYGQGDFGPLPRPSQDQVSDNLDRKVVDLNEVEVYGGAMKMNPSYRDYPESIPYRPRSTVELLGKDQQRYFRLMAIRIKVQNPLPPRDLGIPHDHYTDPGDEKYSSRLDSIDETPPPVRLTLGYYGLSYTSPSTSQEHDNGGGQPAKSRTTWSTDSGGLMDTAYPLFSKNNVLQDGTWQTYLLPRPINMPKSPPNLFSRIDPQGVRYYLRVVYESKQDSRKYLTDYGPDHIPLFSDLGMINLQSQKNFRLR